MLPDLFHIPILNLPIHTYGVLVVLGFLLAVFIAYRRCLQYGNYENDLLDFAFWALVGGILGARIVFIAVEWRDYFIVHPWTQIGFLKVQIPRVFALWHGGLVYSGSFLGGLLAGLIFAYKRRIPLLLWTDLLVVGIPLAQMLGRVGCLAAGCCYGKPFYHLEADHKVVSDLPLFLQFPAQSLTYNSLWSESSAPIQELMQQMGETVPLFPSQLAEALGCMMIFFILLFTAPYKRFHGQLLLSYIALYSAMRFGLEFFRGDQIRGYVVSGALSTSQFISLAAIVVVCFTAVILRMKANSATH